MYTCMVRVMKGVRCQTLRGALTFGMLKRLAYAKDSERRGILSLKQAP